MCVAEPSCFEISSINIAPGYGQQYINNKKQPAGGTQDLQMSVKWFLVRFLKLVLINLKPLLNHDNDAWSAETAGSKEAVANPRLL